MANYTVMNPGKHPLGVSFNFPPIQNRTYKEDLIIKSIKWKTSTLIGRRIYVGNVEIVDSDGKARLLSDSIFKSKSNKFDTFTMDRRIDVAVGDGEEIIRLAGYADRILQFKQNTLHVINATKDSEFLESTHKFKGVSNHNAVCETDYGIAWCNAHGVYLYNGEQILDIFEKQGLRSISDSTWNTFYKADETMIGYIADTRQLLVVRGVTDVSGNGDVMLYNMVTQSWTKATGRITSEDKTNLVNIWDGRLVFGYESDTHEITVVPWKVDPTSASLDVVDGYKVQTKELNFGTQSRKKVSKVRITYKGTGTNVNVLPKYAINGGDFSHSFQDENGIAISNIAGSANWAEIELYTDSNANNIRSFAIQLTDSSAANVVSNFEVNDITIIYRTKSVK